MLEMKEAMKAVAVEREVTSMERNACESVVASKWPICSDRLRFGSGLAIDQDLTRMKVSSAPTPGKTKDCCCLGRGHLCGCMIRQVRCNVGSRAKSTYEKKSFEA